MTAALVFVITISLTAQGCSERPEGDPEEPAGLQINQPEAFDGLNLFGPIDSGMTYLMDNSGRIVHTWESDYRPALQPYLLPNGNLLRSGAFGLFRNNTFRTGGAGYRIEEFTWEGEKVWEFVYSSDQHTIHHDIEPLPNGNVLILAWEMKTEEEAIAAGRNPEWLKDGELWSEHIIEVKPVRPDGGEIVWEWHLWDHLIQNRDTSKDNYGDVAAHPELVDINPIDFWLDSMSDENMEQLEALGYLGTEEREQRSKPNPKFGSADWLHINSIDYNANHDLIALSVLGNNELWVLDHSTTTEEAKGHTGGRHGKGGDLLYRWGNPMTYGAGTESDQLLFRQHDVHWIPEGLPGAGDMLLFNNGLDRSDGKYSTVMQITPPFTKDEGFARTSGDPWGPTQPKWEYTAPNKEDFYSINISGAQRLPNGNTLICSGAPRTFFEVTPDKQEVWRFVMPRSFPSDSKNPDRWIVSTGVFRVYRYARDYAAFAGKDLTPGPVLTDHLKEHPVPKPLTFKDRSRVEQAAKAAREKDQKESSSR
jgi:hypothetical protein